MTPAGVGPAGVGSGAASAVDAKLGVRSSPTISIARRILAVIQPCTGDRATGTVKLKAKAGLTVRVPRGCYGFPQLNGTIRPELLFKTAEGPEDDGSWLVSDSGTDVTFISNIGGERHNIAKDTPFVVDPASPVLVRTPLPLVSSAFTGGTDLIAFGAVKSAVIYETMEGPSIALDARRSKIGLFPAVVVTWIETQPADGTTIPRTARETRLGTRKSLYSYDFMVSVMMTRADTDHERRHEGLVIADTLSDLLIDRMSVDEECISAPSGVQIRNIFRETGPQEVYKKFYVYNLLVSAMGAREQLDSRTFNDWLLAVLNVDKPDKTKGPIRVVDDNQIDME